MAPYLDTSVSNYNSPVNGKVSTLRKSPEADLPATPKTDFARPLDTRVVKDKTALIQDGAKGLGLGIATALAENGANVAICNASEENGEKVAKELTDRGFSVRYFKCDTSSWDSLLAAFKEVLVWSGDQLDIVVTSPGIVTNNLLMSVLPKHVKPGDDPPKPPTNCLEVSLMGVYFITSLALFYFNSLYARRHDRRFRPQLLFICSMAGYDGLDFGTDYAAAKHGVRAIWKTTRRPRESMAQYQSNLLAPTYTRKKNIAGQSEEKMKNHQNQTNEIEDVVAGAMRCICDEQVEGRAICCCQGSIGKPGSLNFDLGDDLIDANAGAEILSKVDDIWLPSSAKLSEDSNCAVQ